LVVNSLECQRILDESLAIVLKIGVNWLAGICDVEMMFQNCLIVENPYEQFQFETIMFQSLLIVEIPTLQFFTFLDYEAGDFRR
jgi:hypothetical protein